MVLVYETSIYPVVKCLCQFVFTVKGVRCGTCMKSKKIVKFRVLMVIAAVLIVISIAVIFMRQIHVMVTNNNLTIVNEMAKQSQNIVQNYVEIQWEYLEGIAQRFESYNSQTMAEMEEYMNLECTSSEFRHLCLVAEDGSIYSDEYFAYGQNSTGQIPGIELLPYFEENDSQAIVARYDGPENIDGIEECMLYGIRLDGFSVDGIRIVGLVGISEISSFENRLIANSFEKDGEYREDACVIDVDGNYVVNVNRQIYLSPTDNLFEQFSQKSNTEMSNDEIAEKMRCGDAFSFSFTDEFGDDKIIRFTPFNKITKWYLVTVISNAVLTEQSRQFIWSSMVMLILILVIVLAMMAIVMHMGRQTLQAEAESKARAEFLSTMSHEIRTPLNGVIGLVHLMKRHYCEHDDEQMGDWLDKAQNTATYLLALVNDILDISKMQVGKVDLKIEPLAVENLIDSIWSMQRSNIEKRGISFVVEREITVPYIMGDETRIKQVLMNIVGNAAKYTAEGGHITFTTVQKQDAAACVSTIFTVTDTGCGMSEDFLRHIWDSFSQERNRNSDSVKGTGLGMTISKLLVDAMGGEISVTSKPDVGSTFRVVIPSKIAEAVPEDTILLSDESIKHFKSTAQEMMEQKPMKILVAEDNELNAEILYEILIDWGFEVELAANGEEALEKFAGSEPYEFGVILMDMQMPVMDGCTAAAAIRKLDRPDAQAVFIYACTANTFKEDRDKAFASGMNDFLTKPIDVNYFLKKMESRKPVETPSTTVG